MVDKFQKMTIVELPRESGDRLILKIHGVYMLQVD